MADAVGFGEHLGKEIPVLLREKVLRDGAFRRDAAQELIPEHAELSGRSVRIAQADVRILPEAGENLLLERGGPRREPVVGVMRSPFHELDAVDARRQTRLRDVQNRDALAGRAQVIPEGRGSNEVRSGRGRTRKFRLELLPAMNALPRGSVPV
jgi:hypothetical protein